MISREADKLTGSSAGVHVQALVYVLIGLLEGLVYVLILPFVRSFIAGDMSAALKQALIAGAVAVVYGILYYVFDSRGYLVGVKKLLGPVQRRMGNHIARLPLGWFTKERGGYMSNLLTRDLQMLMNLPGIFLRQYVHSIVTPIVIGVVFFYIDWRLGIGFFALTPFLVAVFQWSGKTAGKYHKEEEKASAEIASRFIEFAQAQPSLRASGVVGANWNGIDTALKNDYNATRTTLNKTTRPIFIQTVLVQLIYLVVLVISAILFADASVEHFGIAEFFFVGIIALRAVDALNMVGQQGMALRVSQNAIDLCNEVLADEPLKQNENELVEKSEDSSIEFDNVRFSYDDSRTVIDGVSLSVPQGSLTALVGLSGSGKTTLTRLIARFWDVQEGSVRIGGVDVRDMDTADLMKQIALVFQNVYLFDGTIEENIRIGNPQATDEQVRKAACLARLDEVAARLENGWDTPVGEGGKRLSGGERQRVSIARAFLKDAPIVLFDEATAALDAENEAAIVDAMHELAKERTVIAIAHRLSTIAGADQIAVLDAGRLVQLGKHDELISQKGIYASFWAEREAAAGWHINM
ncbi:MAG: ABC transporter ATP-binding protein [Actinomycetaceae bacterium]|nr:ABC transporter ATP-binding protein [Actinomycetaceae bacterium]